MASVSLELIERKVQILSAKINVPEHLLPSYGYTRDFAYPHIETDNEGNYHFVVVERGMEIERRTTNIEDTLLYWIFSGATFSMACNYEVKNRVSREDPRRLIFFKQEELLRLLNKDWQERTKLNHEHILKAYPFDDQL